MYPHDSITETFELIGPGNQQILPSGDFTVLGASLQQSQTASVTRLKCGTKDLMVNYGKDFPFTAMQYRCVGQPLTLEKTGQDDAFVTVTYVERDLYNDPISTTLSSGFLDIITIFWLFFGIVIFTLGIYLGKDMFRR